MLKHRWLVEIEDRIKSIPRKPTRDGWFAFIVLVHVNAENDKLSLGALALPTHWVFSPYGILELPTQ